MDNGLYSVHFSTPFGRSTGVVTLRDGTIQGGDTMMYYVGSFTHDGETLRATIQVKRFAPGENLIGRDTGTLEFSGKPVSPTSGDFLGSLKEIPGVTVTVGLRRLV